MIEIRKAIISDFDEIYELLVKLYYKNKLTKKRTLELFKLELKNNETSQIVAVIDKKIIGFVAANNRINYQDQKVASLLTCLIVDEKLRGNGIGTKLLFAIENVCKDKNSTELQFSSTFKREEAHKFYESQGYNKTAYFFWKIL